MPLTFVQGVPAIQLSVGSKTVTGLIDTGTSTAVVVAENFAALNGARTSGSLVLESAGGSYSMSRGELFDVKIGGCRFAKLPVSIASSAMRRSGNSVMFQPDTVLLGRDFLDDFDWTFDFDRRLASAKATPASTWQDRTVKAYAAPWRVRGRNGQCLLDTGFAHAAQFFIYSSSLLGKNLLAEEPMKIDAPHSGSESGRVWQFLVADGAIGQMAGQGLVVDVEIAKPGPNSRGWNYCVVGMGLLSNGILKLHSAEREAEIVGDLPVGEYNRAGVTSMQFGDKGGAVVGLIDEIRKGSSFDLAGMQKGDLLLTVNGQPLGGSSSADLTRLFMRPAGTEIRVAFLRGRERLERSIILADDLVDLHRVAPETGTTP